MSKNKALSSIFIVVLISVPGVLLRLLHPELAPTLTALVTGTAILGASFLLLWACDAAQADIPQTLALAVVALIAVLPEYAVDMYFTWMAGKYPHSNYSTYAIANMTGANRLLIGVGWSVIVFLYWLRVRKPVILEDDRRLEIFFLGLATIYAFVVPMKGTLTIIDGAVFLALYAWYIFLAGKRECTECEAEGPAEYIVSLPKGKRRGLTLVMFLYAAGVILACAEPFSEGLVASGKVLGINEFLLVQWLAPIASEAPEFTVAIMFASRGQAGVALGSLLSAKVNQWTLLVGMIPGVYALSAGSLGNPIPMNAFQMHEILLTAAQSLLAVALLAELRLGATGALTLLALFAGQLLLPFVFEAHPQLLPWKADLDSTHLFFSVVYVVLALGLLMYRYKSVYTLRLVLKKK